MFYVVAPTRPIIVYKSSDHRQRNDHVHGEAIERKMGTITRDVAGVRQVEDHEFIKYRLVTGEEFWEFENNMWQDFYSYSPDDSPQCCKDAGEKHFTEPKQEQKKALDELVRLTEEFGGYEEEFKDIKK